MTDIDTLRLQGGQSAKSKAVTAAYTVTSDDYLILADATGGAFTVTLPPLADCITQLSNNVKIGRVYRVMKTDAGGNAVTVDADGTETINGATTVSLATQYTDCLLQAAEDDAGAVEWVRLTG